MANLFGELFQYVRPRIKHLHHELPYRLIDQDNICHNSNSLGFGLETVVLSAGNAKFTNSMNALFKEKLPQGKKWHYQFVLTGNHKIAPQLQYNLEQHQVRGDVYAKLAQMSTAYAKASAINGFHSKLGDSAQFDLKHHRAFFFASTFDKSAKSLTTIKKVRETFTTALSTQGIQSVQMAGQDMVNYLYGILNHDQASIQPLSALYNADQYLSNQICDISTCIDRVQPEWLDLTFQGDKSNSTEKTKQRLVFMNVKSIAPEWYLNLMPEVLSSSSEISQALSCPFLLSLNFQVEDSAEALGQVNKKMGSLGKWANSKMAKFMPLIVEEYQDYQAVQKGMMDNQCSLVQLSMDLILITNEQDYQQDMAMAESLFRQKLDVSVARYMQSQALLFNLPFMGLSLFPEVKRAGRTHRVTTQNLANMLPMVAEWSGAESGLLFAGIRNQLSFFNPFAFPTDNANTAVAGASGSGKSVMMQLIILDVISRGGKAWAIDMGKSYRKLAKTKGLEAVYMDPSNIRLNPFTHLDRDKLLRDPEKGQAAFGHAIELITGLFAAMASPDEEISSFRFDSLQKCVEAAYKKHGQQTLVDHVIEEINILSAKQVEHDRRIADFETSLHKYSTKGLYSAVFNEPSDLRSDCPFTCLEIGSFSDNILKPVLFALLIDINNKIYLNDDGVEKLFIIEEAWKQLKSNNKKIQEAIEKALRTFRKHLAALMIVTQNVEDYWENALTKAVFNISDIKLIMRQGDSFAKFAKDNEILDDHEIHAIERFEKVKHTGFSSVLIKAGNLSAEYRLFLDPFTRILTSTNAPEVIAVDDYVRSGLSMAEAVEQVATEVYPEEMQILHDSLKSQVVMT